MVNMKISKILPQLEIRYKVEILDKNLVYTTTQMSYPSAP